MSKGANRRAQWKAVRAYLLRQDGMSKGDIAKTLDVPKERVDDMILRGERLEPVLRTKRGEAK